MLMAAVAYRRKPVLCGGKGGRERGVRKERKKGRCEEGEEEREV